MLIHNRPFEALDESDLQALVDDHVQEAKTIEYKQSLPGNSDGEKKEFLYDVTSFANASGGLLIYGMREKDGRAEELAGLEAADVDARMLRLQSVILSGVDPRIPGLGIRPVPLGTGRVAILIRVPKSWALPHMVKYGGSSKFYSRNSAEKYQLDVAELRSLFALSETTAERVRNFRAERLMKIIAGETPVPMDEHPRLVLHLIPLGAFDPAARFDLSSLQRETDNFRPMRASAWNGPRHNFDGMYTYATQEKLARAYVQLFRSGIVEAVDTSMLSYEGDRRVLRGLTRRWCWMASSDTCRYRRGWAWSRRAW